MLSRNFISNLAKLTVSALALLMVAVIALTIVSSKAMAEPKCKFVNGHLEEELEEPVVEPCWLNATGRMIGGIQGEYNFCLLTFTDPDEHGILLFTGTSVIETQDGDLLYLWEAGAHDTDSPGNLVDLQTITGGTGAFKEATGQIFLFGNFDLTTGTGASDYRGEICTP